MDRLVEILYMISTALLVPVIVLLLGFLLWSFLEVGGFLREWRERRKGAAPWRRYVGLVQNQSNPPQQEAAARFFLAEAPYPGLLGTFARKGKALFRSELHLGKLVSDLEIEAGGRISRMNLGTRVGPMIGLMGTLIPMGPALIGLSTGNIEQMATNLVVAFSTTVLGLLVGGLCYAMSLARRRWYWQDLSDIDYVYRCLHPGAGTD